MKKMIKRISFLALALVLMLGMTVTSFADTKANVDFVDHAEEFIFEPGSEYSLTDLFPNFKGVMPGDTLTQQIDIRNVNDKDYITVYMRALGAHQGDGAEATAEYEAFLSQLDLTVEVVGGDRELFDAKANETAQLTDWVKLVNLMPAQTYMTLEVSLHVPIEMDNTYMDKIGKLDWRFKVEQFEWKEVHTEENPSVYDDEEDDGSGEENAEGDGEQNKDDGAQTGDDSNMMPVMLVALAALLAAIAAVAVKRRKPE